MATDLLFKTWFLIFLSLLMVSLGALGSETLQKNEIKNRFKSLSVAQRDENIAHAIVTRKDYRIDETSRIDILEVLKKECGSSFGYDHEGATWPQLTCRYHPNEKKSLGGYSAKFHCDFQIDRDSDRLAKRKVKYAHSDKSLGRSEVTETIAAPILTKLIGFYSETYCPVSVTCLDCPSSHPWLAERASVPGVPGNQAAFRWAVVEREINAFTLSNKNDLRHSQGLAWNEIAHVQTQDRNRNRQMRIEREAWVLWMSFLQATDSHDANQRISCLKYQIQPGSQPICTEPMIYTHDYGHSFFQHFKFDRWADLPALESLADQSGCRGTLNYPNAATSVRGLVIHPLISAEARDLLVKRLSQITDQQLTVIYNLAQLQISRGVTLKQWIQTFRLKIQEMTEASCLPLDSKTSHAKPSSVLSL